MSDNLNWEGDAFEEAANVAVVDPLAGVELERPVESLRPSQSASVGNGRRATLPLYLDIETVPDEERMHLFDLPALPEVPPTTTSAKMPDPMMFLDMPLDRMEAELLQWNPEPAYLELLVAEEQKKNEKKPRAGVAALAGKLRSRRESVVSAEEDRRKLLSCTPEFCRIVAVGWAAGNSEVLSWVDGQDRMPGGALADERYILGAIWDLIRQHGPVVGYNVLGFDLAVIRARSILLGVEPSRLLNDSPWGNRDVTDLMAARFGRNGKAMKLKKLAKLYGIPVPAGETNGADVAQLLADDPEKLGQYVRSDVTISRELHGKFSGYFCA